MITPWQKPSTAYARLKSFSGAGPWKTMERVELATPEWGAWLNHQGLLLSTWYIPPAEVEARYYLQLAH